MECKTKFNRGVEFRFSFKVQNKHSILLCTFYFFCDILRTEWKQQLVLVEVSDKDELNIEINYSKNSNS